MSDPTQLKGSPVIATTSTPPEQNWDEHRRGRGGSLLEPPRSASPAPSTGSNTSSWISRSNASPGPRRRDRLLARLKGTTSPDLGLEEDELPMTEEELREIFEEEEIQRFLGTFHSVRIRARYLPNKLKIILNYCLQQVGEVTLPDSPEFLTGSNQKIVIVPAEDARDVARAGAAPASATVEVAPSSVIGDAPSLIGDEDDDDESSDESDVDEEAWIDVEKDQPRIFEPEEGLPSKASRVHAKRPPPVWGSEKAAAVRRFSNLRLRFF